MEKGGWRQVMWTVKNHWVTVLLVLWLVHEVVNKNLCSSAVMYYFLIILFLGNWCHDSSMPFRTRAALLQLDQKGNFFSEVSKSNFPRKVNRNMDLVLIKCLGTFSLVKLQSSPILTSNKSQCSVRFLISVPFVRTYAKGATAAGIFPLVWVTASSIPGIMSQRTT